MAKSLFSKINLNSSFNQRQNNELLNIDQQGLSQTSLTCYSLENADFFYEGSLATRNGSVDLSNGIANLSFSGVTVTDTTLISGTSYQWVTLPGLSTSLLDYPATIYIPSGAISLTENQVRVRGLETNANYNVLGNAINNQLYVRGAIFELNQAPARAFGNSYMSGINASGLHNIALTGNYNVPPYPEYFNTTNPVISQGQAVPAPVAQSPLAFAEALVNLGSYTQDITTNWSSAPQDVILKFSAPVALNSGRAYAIRYTYAFSSGCNTVPQTNRGMQLYTVSNTGVDISPNTVIGEEFFFAGGPTPPQIYAIRLGTINGQSLPNKTWSYGNIKAYASPQFLNPDYATASSDLVVPAIRGTNPSSFPTIESFGRILGAANIGQVIQLPSGNHNFFGAYAYFGLNNRPQFTLYNADNTPFTSPVNINVTATLNKIVTSSGSLSNGNYIVTRLSGIATASGNIVLDRCSSANFGYGNQIQYQPNQRLSKTYFVFDNPVTLSGNGAGLDHILTFEFRDSVTGGPYQGYAAQPVNPFIISTSALTVGTEMNTQFKDYSGALLTDYYGNNNYYQFSGIYGNLTVVPNISTMDLTCGLIDIPDNNAITLVYDYRVGNDRIQKVIYGQGGNLYWSTFQEPEKENWTRFYSSGINDNNALWTATTFQDLLFAHQYGQSPGQVWSTFYSGVSYEHGKRPTFTASGYTGAGSGLQSGTYQVILATSMDSGGYRSSIISGVSIQSGQWIHISNLNMQNQFPFDLSTQSTNIFMTVNSGNIFYQPTLYDAPTASPLIFPQPIANNVSGVFINTPINTAVDLTIPEAINLPQSYLTSQITTPRFKKISPFFNYLCGIGVNESPSTFYYSEIQAPQIWGTAGDFHGSISINPQDGDILTSIEPYKQYLIAFKKNSTYRIEFLEEGGLPFAVTPISSTLGVLGAFCTVSTEVGIFGLSQMGPVVCNGATTQTIGQEIYPWFRELDHNDLTFSYAIHDQANNIITWSIGNDSVNPDRNFGLVYNYKTQSWIIRKGVMFNCGNIVRDEDNFNQVWIGDVLGQVKLDNVGSSDSELVFADGNGIDTVKAIQLVAETPWISYLDSADRKLYRFLSLNTEQATNSVIRVDVFFDYSPVPSYTRTMTLNQAKSDNRISLGGHGKIVKFKIYNAGVPNKVKINKMNIELQYLGDFDPS